VESCSLFKRGNFDFHPDTMRVASESVRLGETNTVSTGEKHSSDVENICINVY